MGVNTQVPQNQGGITTSLCGGDGLLVCGGISERGGVNADNHDISTVPFSLGVGAGVGVWGTAMVTKTVDLRPAMPGILIGMASIPFAEGWL